MLVGLNMKPADLEYRILEAFSRMKHIKQWENLGEYNRSEMHLLGVVCCREGNQVKVNEILSATGMQPASVSRSLKNLEKRGLIVRSADPGNRRNVVVTATAEGRKAAEANIARVHDYWSDVLLRMPEQDLEEMLRIWNAIMDNMEKVLEERKAGLSGRNPKETAADI